MIKVTNIFPYKIPVVNDEVLVIDAKLVKMGLKRNPIPILISETEKVKRGDLFYYKDNNIEKVDVAEEDLTAPYYKVLAVKENFTSEQLYDMDNGILRNGDYVLLECIRRGLNHEGVDADLTGGVIIHKKDYYSVKTTSKNYVNFFPKKKDRMFTAEEVVNLLSRICVAARKPEQGGLSTFYPFAKKWFDENVK